jgi:hypothetical protein
MPPAAWSLFAVAPHCEVRTVHDIPPVVRKPRRGARRFRLL